MSTGQSRTPDTPQLPRRRPRRGSGTDHTPEVKIGLISAVTVALIGAAATVVAAIINQEPPTSGDTPSPTTPMLSDAAASQSPTPVLVPGNHANVQFTTPPNDFEIVAGQGDVDLSGTVTGLGTDTLWILSWHSSGGSFYMVPAADGSISPAATKDGPLAVTDQNVGDLGDRGKEIIYYAVQANLDCTHTLSLKNTYDSFRGLPEGCIPVNSIRVLAR
jgi:hypothetical protein